MRAVGDETNLANWLDPSLELAWSALQEFQWNRELRPQEYREFRYNAGDTNFKLSSDGWVEKLGRLNLRWTRLQGVKLDIATLMCYPTNRPDLLPVFAFEWVIVGGRGHAMICDVEVCGSQRKLENHLRSVFHKPAETFTDRFQSRECPPWFEEIAQPHAQLFTASLDQLDHVFDLQQQYLALTVEKFYRPLLSSGLKGGPDQLDVTEYKYHHAQHSPGTAMLKKWYGAQKAHEFLFKYHFGPAQTAGKPAAA